jgi:hypothetical protein
MRLGMHKYTPPEADLEDSANNIYAVLEKISNGSFYTVYEVSSWTDRAVWR